MTALQDIMRASPLDAAPTPPSELVQLARAPREEWVPSRFNARTVGDDGRMVLWNSYSGAISAFEPAQVHAVEQLLSRSGIRGNLGPLAIYLRDRGYLVPRGTNELRRLRLKAGQQQYRTDVLQLILLTSEDCNFRCVYCYEDFKRGTMTVETREAVKALVRKRAPFLRQLSISYFGGEPLYGIEAIEDLAPFFTQIVDEHELGFGGAMTTNGYLLTPDVADKLLAWRIRDFQITLDGPAADHDRKRHGRDGRGTFDTIFANLQAMRRRSDDFRITIRVNFDRENHPHLDDFVEHELGEFAGDARFDVSFHGVGKWGGPNDSNLPTCGVDEGKQARKRLNAAAAARGLEIRNLQSMSKPGTGVCYAARPFNFIVGAEGALMKCTVALDKEDYNIVGRISAEGDLQLDPDKMALWTELAFEEDTGCQKCYLVPVCQGMHCPLIRIEHNTRPCMTLRSELRDELITTYQMGREKGRRVSMGAARAGV